MQTIFIEIQMAKNPICSDRNVFMKSVGNMECIMRIMAHEWNWTHNFRSTFTSATSGRTEYGYIGYWGASLGDGSNATNGMQVTRQNYDGSKGGSYTLFKSEESCLSIPRKK